MKTFRLMSTLFFLFVLCLGIHAAASSGGDISFAAKLRRSRNRISDEAGKAVAPSNILKEEGWNAIRVRLFVERQGFGRRA